MFRVATIIATALSSSRELL